MRGIDGTRGTAALTAIPVLLGLGIALWGALTAVTNPGYGLVLMGLGIVIAGLGGPLAFKEQGLKVSGALGGVIMAVGAMIAYLPR